MQKGLSIYVSLATIGVCVFYASASVGAFFNLGGKIWIVKKENTVVVFSGTER